MVRAYGYTIEQFNQIVGNKTVLSFKDDCLNMLGLMDDEQLEAMRAVMSQILRKPQCEIAASEKSELPQ